MALTLTPGTGLGLFFIQRYRFLTITQYARAAALSYDHAAETLRRFELHGLIGYFGHVRIPATERPPRPTTSSARAGSSLGGRAASPTSSWAPSLRRTGRPPGPRRCITGC